jgi:hypothetical protein
LYRVHLAWAGFEFTTLVVIYTDCIGSCKSYYHTITTTTAPKYQISLIIILYSEISSDELYTHNLEVIHFIFKQLLISRNLVGQIEEDDVKKNVVPKEISEYRIMIKLIWYLGAVVVVIVW